jgi:hypothetical protein
MLFVEFCDVVVVDDGEVVNTQVLEMEQPHG